LSSKVVYENPWIRIHEDAVVRPDGSQGIYGYMELRDSVIIVVLNDEGEIYLVRGFSYPVRSWSWQLPGGGGDGEEAEAASKRELAEETGIVSNKWTFLGKVRVCDGLMTERMSVYLAQELSFAEKPDSDDADVVGQGQFFSPEVIDKMVDAGEIDDGQTITALFLARNFLRQVSAAGKQRSLQRPRK